MLSLNPEKLKSISIPVGTGWLLGACMEARGKQELWTRQKPEILKVLREQALIQSVESSNRIEGVTIAADRLRPVIVAKDKPRDRPEEELAGYRQALDWIFSRNRPVAPSPAVIRKLHAFAQGGQSGDAGLWKKKNNEIIEILPTGERKIRFTPTSAKDTPQMVDLLCRNYQLGLGKSTVPPLLVLSTFVFDFLCIHPFRDGNGRVSRLLTTLLLQNLEFSVCRYISLERLVEQSKEEYYSTLAECSRGWHEGKNEIHPWWNFFLGVLHRAYKEFEQRVEFASKRPAKSDLIRQTIMDQVDQFTLGELSAQVPSVSPQLVKKVLSELKKAGKITLSGRGRGARWRKLK
jgi:Fic family protein